MYVALRTEYLQSSSLSDYFGVGLHCCSVFSARINHVIGEMSFHFHMFFFFNCSTYLTVLKMFGAYTAPALLS